jgi:ubiquinone/menaquinone biosynthesis C-methylase UbiE
LAEQVTLEGDIAGNKVLDVTSGFLGMQYEVHVLAGINLDMSGFRKVTVRGDFTALPFRDNYFETVLFDPSHTIDKRNTLLGTMADTSGLGPHIGAFKYGCYHNMNQLRKGLWKGAVEAYRVLAPGGSMIFKWSNSEKPYSWATDTVEKAVRNFDKIRVNVRKSGASTGNYTFYAWYRKK